MRQSLHDAWRRLATHDRPRAFPDALAVQLLQAGSLAYGVAVALRNAGYDRGWRRPVRLSCPVVSVGNLTVGGTGKTACVELIARKLLDRGRRVAVLSRGYGARRRDYWLQWDGGQLRVNGQAEAALDGLADEPQLLAEKLPGVPVVVGARRERTGRLACRQFDAEAVILDDGFQHRRLHRDYDIVLIPARMPLGGWAVLPRGPMREPLSALTRADCFLITKADQSLETVGALSERLRALHPGAHLLTASHEPCRLTDGMTGERMDPSRLAGRSVGAISSIGDPEGFEATLAGCDAQVAWHRAFPDHHPYRPEEWSALAARATQDPPAAIVTTEKDWVRLRSLVLARPPGAVPVWVLAIRLKLLSGEADLDARLAALEPR